VRQLVRLPPLGPRLGLHEVAALGEPVEDAGDVDDAPVAPGPPRGLDRRDDRFVVVVDRAVDVARLDTGEVGIAVRVLREGVLADPGP
jgi:hypothetical protein